ncbi:MAG: exosortase-associated EpsI family protein [Phycisphaerae bacterium]|nr:exosortase-associated EpsI family protein [Phycisphaerae bacterium]
MVTAMGCMERVSDLRVAVGLVLVLAVGLGLMNRLVAARVSVAVDQVTPTLRPLADMPMHVGTWRGEDIPLDRHMVKIAREDDCLSRMYVDPRHGRAVWLYIGYIGRVRSWLGHRPDACYVSQGWELRSQRETHVRPASGRAVPATLYEFAHPSRGAVERVLAIYIVNGAFCDDRSYLKYNRRHPNLFGSMGAFLARIQIATAGTRSAEDDYRLLAGFVSEIVEPVVACMPYFESPGTGTDDHLAARTEQ